MYQFLRADEKTINLFIESICKTNHRNNTKKKTKWNFTDRDIYFFTVFFYTYYYFEDFILVYAEFLNVFVLETVFISFWIDCLSIYVFVVVVGYMTEITYFYKFILFLKKKTYYNCFLWWTRLNVDMYGCLTHIHNCMIICTYMLCVIWV